MSAYLVEAHHIAYIASYYVNQCDKGQDPMLTAEILAQANLDSLAARYNDDAEDPEYITECQQLAASAYWHTYDPLQVIKSAMCYEYQTCEIEDYENTAAARICERIQSHALRAVPGMDRREWGAPEPNVEGMIRLSSLCG